MLHELAKKVMEFARRYELFADAEGILLAVSGGADSVALLHVLVSLRAEGFLSARLVCAHINHSLRGPASEEDERFVIKQAAKVGLPVIAKTVDVRGWAEEQRLSLETAGRQLRLAGLAEMARAQGCACVATGHQKNDNAETVIHRLCRGTGIRGLAGIRPRRPLGDGLWLARPLLDATRAEIVRYLEEHKLTWREDRTNADPAYTRNAIRHRLLPALQQESRHCLVEELSDLAASAAKLHDRIQREAKELKSRLVRPVATETAIDAADLRILPEMVAVELVRQVLVDLGCGERDLTQRHYQDLLRLARPCVPGARLSLPHGFSARREQNHVMVGARGQATARGAGPVTVPVPGKVPYADCEIEAMVLDRCGVEFARPRNAQDCFCEYFDLDRLQPPLVVRSRRAGDRFYPLGLDAEKKIGKFLSAAKVPRGQRERVLIFADREKIIWVSPVRVSEQTKVVPTTRRVLALRVSRLPGSETQEPA